MKGICVQALLEQIVRVLNINPLFHFQAYVLHVFFSDGNGFLKRSFGQSHKKLRLVLVFQRAALDVVESGQSAEEFCHLLRLLRHPVELHTGLYAVFVTADRLVNVTCQHCSGCEPLHHSHYVRLNRQLHVLLVVKRLLQIAACPVVIHPVHVDIRHAVQQLVLQSRLGIILSKLPTHFHRLFVIPGAICCLNKASRPPLMFSRNQLIFKVF